LVGNDVTRPLSPEVRGRLVKFLADTERYATPALDSQIDDEISMLMISFKTGRTISEAEATATVAAYTHVLRGLPIWAIRQGFGKIARGQIEGVSKDFAPTAPRLRQVVTDEMIPLRADRTEVERILKARETPIPDNPDMAARVAEAAKQGLNVQQLKYGKNYGIGGTLPVPEFDQPAMAHSTFKAPQGQALVDHYARHNLAFQPKPNSDRNGDRDDDVTFHDDREAVSR
jgi:hypothetical protein